MIMALVLWMLDAQAYHFLFFAGPCRISLVKLSYCLSVYLTGSRDYNVVFASVFDGSEVSCDCILVSRMPGLLQHPSFAQLFLRNQAVAERRGSLYRAKVQPPRNVYLAWVTDAVSRVPLCQVWLGASRH